MPPSPIAIDRAQMSLGSPPAELEVIASSSSSRVTPRPPPRIQADDDGASDGGEGDPEEFRKFSDQELQTKIKRLRSLHATTPDGGQKSRKLVHRVERELDRRRAAGSSKVSEMRGLRNRFMGDFSELRAFPQSGFVYARIIDSWMGKFEKLSSWVVFSFRGFSGFTL